MNDVIEKTVKVAVPTNDGVNIFPKMLGMAEEMFIYEIDEGGKSEFLEKRKNPYANTMQHLKTLDVYEIINDCEIILSSHIGKKGVERLEERGVKLFFQKGRIEEALKELGKKIYNME